MIDRVSLSNIFIYTFIVSMLGSGITEILPTDTLVLEDDEELLHPILCAPKLLPIKSFSLERLEKLEKKIKQDAQKRRDEEKKRVQEQNTWGAAAMANEKSKVPALTPPTVNPPPVHHAVAPASPPTPEALASPVDPPVAGAAMPSVQVNPSVSLNAIALPEKAAGESRDDPNSPPIPLSSKAPLDPKKEGTSQPKEDDQDAECLATNSKNSFVSLSSPSRSSSLLLEYEHRGEAARETAPQVDV